MRFARFTFSIASCCLLAGLACAQDALVTRAADVSLAPLPSLAAPAAAESPYAESPYAESAYAESAYAESPYYDRYYDATEVSGSLEAFSGDCQCGEGNDGKCDCAANAKKAAGAHKGVFYANDFSYLHDACQDNWYLGDRVKQMQFGCWTVDVGGQYRMRFQSEQNIRNSAAVPNGLGLTGNDDDFLLHRTRLYVNAEYGRHLRFYGEMLDAVSEFERNATPRPIEENRTEMQNLFGEVRGIAVGPGTVGARVGRQEVLLGAQRLVSPLDWSNTRRTFDGARAMWQGDRWDVDAIWLRPMKRNNAHRRAAARRCRLLLHPMARQFLGSGTAPKIDPKYALKWYSIAHEIATSFNGKPLNEKRALSNDAPLVFIILSVVGDRETVRE